MGYDEIGIVLSYITDIQCKPCKSAIRNPRLLPLVNTLIHADWSVVRALDGSISFNNHIILWGYNAGSLDENKNLTYIHYGSYPPTTEQDKCRSGPGLGRLYCELNIASNQNALWEQRHAVLMRMRTQHSDVIKSIIDKIPVNETWSNFHSTFNMIVGKNRVIGCMGGDRVGQKLYIWKLFKSTKRKALKRKHSN